MHFPGFSRTIGEIPELSDMRVSIVDDEKILAGNIAKKLEKNGFTVSVYHGYRQFVNTDRGDSQLYVVDLSLGDGSGFDIIKWLRETRKTTAPIILISGHGDSQNIIRGLDIGADDYLTKPFQPDELVARIRAVVRRSSAQSASFAYVLGKLACDPAKGIVSYDGKPLVLTRNERLLVETLIERPKWIVSRDELIARVWGGGRVIDVSDNTISVTLSNVRKKLGSDFRVRTVYNQGFILEPT